MGLVSSRQFTMEKCHIIKIIGPPAGADMLLGWLCMLQTRESLRVLLVLDATTICYYLWLEILDCTNKTQTDGSTIRTRLNHLNLTQRYATKHCRTALALRKPFAALVTLVKRIAYHTVPVAKWVHLHHWHIYIYIHVHTSARIRVPHKFALLHYNTHPSRGVPSVLPRFIHCVLLALCFILFQSFKALELLALHF